MTPEGYKIVVSALNSNPETMGATVQPEPEPGEDIRDVEISRSGLSRDAVLKVLKEAGLMRMSLQPNPDPNAPKFAWDSARTMEHNRSLTIYRLRDTKVE